MGIKPILKNDFLVITTKGLDELEKMLISREENYFRNRKVKRMPLPYDELLPEKKKKPLIEIAKEKIMVDQIKEARVLTYSLKEYLKDLQQYEMPKEPPKEEVVTEEVTPESP